MNEEIDMVLEIRSLLKDGYTPKEISESIGVDIEFVKNIKTEYQYIDRNNNETFSNKCINVFCVFLEKGISNDQLYDLFHIKKCTRESFNRFCNKLRSGKIHKDISQNYNIPMEPTITIEINARKESENEVYKSISQAHKDMISDRKETARRKRENDKLKTQNAIKRMEERLENNRNKPKKNINTEPVKNTYVNVVNKNLVPVKEITADDILPEFNSTNDNIIPTDKDFGSKVNQICEFLRIGYTAKYISKSINVPLRFVEKIRDGEIYTDISKMYGILSKKSKSKIEDLIKSIEG